MLDKIGKHKTFFILTIFILFIGNFCLAETELDRATREQIMERFDDEQVVDDFMYELSKDNFTKISNKSSINNSRDSVAVEMYIITIDQYVDEFTQFAQIKNDEGINTEVVSTSTIGDSLASIRLWLKTMKQQNDSLTYVLIGGDETAVPIKDYAYYDCGTYKTTTTDFYYSNVLSTWPLDDNVNNINPTTDLYVGRVPARNEQEVTRFINKYNSYKYQYKDHADAMSFITTNIRRINGSTIDNAIIDSIAAHVPSYISKDMIYSSELIDTVNGCAQPIVSELSNRDFGFLYLACHGGDSYCVYNSEYDDDSTWVWQSFGPHKKNFITINTRLALEGGARYRDLDGDSAEYYYAAPQEKYRQLEDVIPDTEGQNYVAWISSCYTTDLLHYQSRTRPALRDSLGEIIQTHHYPEQPGDGPLVIPDTEIPEWEVNNVQCISEAFFNEVGGPVALYSSSALDYPYVTYRLVQKYFDMIYTEQIRTLGVLVRDCWQIWSQALQANRLFKDLFMGYTLFGDPSMEVYTGLIGDFNYDGYVDIADMQLFYDHWHLEEGDPGWDPLYDLNSDGIVDAIDSQIFGDHWHEGTPPTKEKDTGKGPNADACIVLDMNANTAGNQNLVSLPLQPAGNKLSVDVYCTNVHNLDTYEFEIVYDPGKLSYVSSSPENPVTYEKNILATEGGKPTGWMVDSSTPGTVSFAYTLIGSDEAQSPEGEGLIAHIVFSEQANTYGTLRFGDVYYYDTFGIKNDVINPNSLLLPYALSAFTASLDPVNDHTTIDWSTSYEQAVHGFNVYRNTSDDFDSAIKLNQDIIAGHDTSQEINVYSFIDEDVLEAGITYYYWLESVDSNETKGVCEPISLTPGEESGDFSENFDQTVLSNYPNPCRGVTTIAYGIKGMLKSTPVEIKIYNVLGQLVETVEGINGTATWDSKNHSAGIYFYKLLINDCNEIRKMILSK